MDITTRHIRHDWPEWVDWDNQKTVKTMCGVRSRPGLCGIPGITKQKAVVTKNGRPVWGWCMQCVRATFPYYSPPALSLGVTSQAILDLHQEAQKAIAPIYMGLLRKKLVAAKMDNLQGLAESLEQEIDRVYDLTAHP